MRASMPRMNKGLFLAVFAFTAVTLVFSTPLQAQDATEKEMYLQTTASTWPDVLTTCKSQIDALVSTGKLKRTAMDEDLRPLVSLALFSIIDAATLDQFILDMSNDPDSSKVVRCVGDVVLKKKAPVVPILKEMQTSCKSQIDAYARKDKEFAQNRDQMLNMLTSMMYFAPGLVPEMLRDMVKTGAEDGEIGQCIANTVTKGRNAPAAPQRVVTVAVRTLGDGCLTVNNTGTVQVGDRWETTLELKNDCRSLELVEILDNSNDAGIMSRSTWTPKNFAAPVPAALPANRRPAERPTAAVLGFTPVDNALGSAYFSIPAGGIMERRVVHTEPFARGGKIDAILASCRTWENNIEPYIAYRDADLSHWVCKPYLQMPGTN